MDSKYNLNIKTFDDALDEFESALLDNRSKVTDKPLKFHYDITSKVSYMTEDEVESLSDKHLLMVAGALRSIAAVEEKTWESVGQALFANPISKAIDKPLRWKQDFISRDYDTSDIMTNGDLPTSKLIKEVRSMLSRLIRDKDIQDDMRLNDASFMENLVITLVKNLKIMDQSGESFCEEDLLNIGVVKFPDIRSNLIRYFRIEIKAFVDKRKKLFDEIDLHGFSCYFRWRKYNINIEVAMALNSDLLAKGREEGLSAYKTMISKLKSVKSSNTNTVQREWPLVRTTDGHLPTLDEIIKKSAMNLIAFDIKTSSVPAIQAPLVVSFSDTSRECVESLQEDTLIIIAGLCHEISQDSRNITYDNAYAMLHCNHIVSKIDECEIASYAKFLKVDHDNNYFGEDGRPFPYILREIEAWLRDLIDDPRLIHDLRLDSRLFAKFLQDLSKHHDEIGKSEGKKEYFTKPIIDIGILCYPDHKGENFRLCQLKISAFSDCTHQDLINESRSDMEKYILDAVAEEEKKNSKVNIIDNSSSSDDEEAVTDDKKEMTKMTSDPKDEAKTEITKVTSDPEDEDKKEISKVTSDAEDEEESNAMGVIIKDAFGFNAEFVSNQFQAELAFTERLNKHLRSKIVQQGYSFFGL